MNQHPDTADETDSPASVGGGAFPIRTASVDAGSNAIRFLAAEFTDVRQHRVLVNDRVPVRLGHQVLKT